MVLHRVLGDVESLGDLFGRGPANDQVDHLLLAGAKPVVDRAKRSTSFGAEGAMITTDPAEDVWIGSVREAWSVSQQPERAWTRR